MSSVHTHKARYVKPYTRRTGPVHGYLREGTTTLTPVPDLTRHDFTKLLDQLPEGTTFTLAPTDQHDPAWPLRGTWVKQDLGSLVYWWNNQRGLNKSSASFHTPAARQVLQALGLDRGLPKPRKGRARQPHDYLADPQVLVDKGLVPSLHGIKPGLLIQRNIKRAMDTIGNVHKIAPLRNPPPPKVPVVSYHVDGEQGSYRYDIAGGILEPTFIRVDPFAQSPHIAMVHEFAHYLDQQILGGQENFASSEALMNPGKTHLLDGVMGAIRDSQTLKDAMRLRNSAAPVPIMSPTGAVNFVPSTDPAFQKHMLYLLQANELFARAYTQYIALRGDSSDLRREVNRKIDPQFLYPEHWGWDDFAPIADAFDQLFAGLGWREKLKPRKRVRPADTASMVGDGKAATQVRPYIRNGMVVAGYLRERHGNDFVWVHDERSGAVHNHLRDMDLLPSHLWERLAEKGYGVILGSTGVGGIPGYEHLANQRPRGWKGGYTWNNVAGLHDPTYKKIVAGKGNHGGTSLVLHETGHALNRTIEFPHTELEAHHKRLYKKLTPYMRQASRGGPGNYDGTDEMFAVATDTRFKVGREAAVQMFDEEFVAWFEGVLGISASHEPYSASPGDSSTMPSPTSASPSALAGTSKFPFGSLTGSTVESVKATSHVRPYLRDGHLVHGYTREFSPAVKAALLDVLGPYGYKRINGLLRGTLDSDTDPWGNRQDRVTPQEAASLHNQIEVLDNAIASLGPTTEPTRVYRGVQFAWDGIKIAEGDDLVDPGYSWASHNRGFAESYADEAGDLLVIDVPTGSHLLDFAQHPELDEAWRSNEAALMFARGTTFTVDKIEARPGSDGRIVHVTVKPSQVKHRRLVLGLYFVQPHPADRRQAAVKGQVHVRPYLRDGHPVHGYERDTQEVRVLPTVAAAEEWLKEGEARFRGLLWHGTPRSDTIRDEGFAFTDNAVGHGDGPAIWLSDSRPHAEGYGIPVRVAAKFQKPLMVTHTEGSNWGFDFEEALKRDGVDVSKYPKTSGGYIASPAVVARKEGFDAVVRRYPDTVYGPEVPEELRVTPGHLIATAFNLDSLRVIRDDTKAQQHVQVHPYLRDGHLVHGYEQIRDAANAQDVMQIRPEIIEHVREIRSKPGQGDRYTRTTTPVKGRHGTRQALIIQATEFFKAEGDWTAVKHYLDGYTAKREKDDALLAMYNRATRERLTALTTRHNGNRVAVRVPHDVVEQILRDGRLRNANDPAHRLTDRSGKEGSTYVQTRAQAERKVWSIPDDAGPDAHPIYGYVARDDEDLGRNDRGNWKSIAAAFGDTKITLGDHVRPRTTITYSDSLFAGIGRGDLAPSPISDPSELSVAHWMNLGGVKTPIFYKGEQPNVPPPLPPRIRKIEDQLQRAEANGWHISEGQRHHLQTLKNEYYDSVGYQRWPHGDFIEAQIFGGIRLEDIDRIDFDQEPDDAVRRLLEDAGIPWTVGGT